MVSINNVLRSLDERQIARNVGLRHDEARMRYPLNRNTVTDFDEFSRVIGDYYNRHFHYVSNGGSLSPVDAMGRAKDLLDHIYRRKRNSDIVGAFNDAHDGTNGGLRVVLDTIAEALKLEFVERYIRDVFDRHVAPNSWENKVEIIRQFILQCGANLSSSIRAHQPERYAQNFQELIRSYVDSLQRTSSIFRRL